MHEGTRVRGALAAWAVVVGLVAAASALGAPSSARPARSARSRTASFGAPGTYDEAHRMDAAQWTARQDAYLAQETAGALDRTDPDSLLAFAERGRRDAGFDGDISSATAADFADILGPGFSDDFTMIKLLTLWTQDHDLLSPGLAAAVKDKILTWKYWWTERPIRETQGKNYYWTENHQILFLANEYLAGQAFPDETFTPSGLTGRQHVAHAEPRIRWWIARRARYGFSEFLSVPYTAMTFEGVTGIADLAEDASLADDAAKVLDVMLVELASHLEDGAIGGAKGRTYTGNLFDLYGGSTPILASFALGTGTPRTGGTNITLAVAHRYRPPEVARRIAASSAAGVVRQHQSIELDPTLPVTDAPAAPDGLDYDGEDGLLTWWGEGGQFAWQVAPLSVRTIETYNLWNTPNFQIAGANVLENLVKGKTDTQLRTLAQSLSGWLNPGLLPAVDTYTYRHPDAMLSTAQDWRAGQRTESALVSQATLHGGVNVFTNLPKGNIGTGGYWSGDGAAPRAAQHDQTAIALYAPQYDAGGTSGFNGYQTFTHAFFPQDRFDEVVQAGGWTFGRKGNGYVALWSWRPTSWVPFDASVEHPDGVTSPWELQADGGSDDVWITQVGSADQYPGVDGFAAFRTAVLAHEPVVRPMAAGTPCAASTPATLGSCAHGRGDGFLVAYTDARGVDLSFGWAPKASGASARRPALVADGTAEALHGTARWDSPWATAGTDGHYTASAEGATLDLQLSTTAPALDEDEPTTTTTQPGSGGSTTTAPGGTTPTSPPAAPVAGDPSYTG